MRSGIVSKVWSVSVNRPFDTGLNQESCMRVNESSCTFRASNGESYTAAGAWLTPQGGAVYMVERDGILRAETWNGEILAHRVVVVSQWRVKARHGGWHTMRSVRFQVDGVLYAGRYGSDWAQFCRVKAVRS